MIKQDKCGYGHTIRGNKGEYRQIRGLTIRGRKGEYRQIRGLTIGGN